MKQPPKLRSGCADTRAGGPITEGAMS